MRYISIIIVFLVTISVFYSCENNDNFSTNSSLRLTFSDDTIRFDTVFSTIGTATKKFKVYNKNKDALTISSITLKNGSKRGFRMNVDGESGTQIDNVSLLGKDSLYVFVEVTVNPLQQDVPMLVADTISFLVNGVVQNIRLEAVGKDVVILRAKTIDRKEVFVAGKSYLIYDSLYVKNGAVLDIEKNVQLYFHQDAKLRVDGQINAKGTIDQPIVFRGDRTDNFLDVPKVPYDRIPGLWKGIQIMPGSFNNRFENVRIRNASYGVLIPKTDTTQLKVTFLNTIIQNTTQGGLFAVNAKIKAENCLFANSKAAVVSLIGGSYYFLHCTIANYMNPYWGGTVNNRIGLRLSNEGVDEKGNPIKAPLVNTRIINTIISDMGTSGLSVPSNVSSTLDYKFINCLIKMSGSDDLDFINTVWKSDPLFRYIYSQGNADQDPDRYFFYDFHLTETSPAINKGSRTYAASQPYDLDGVSRQSDSSPDIGCYEWK